MVDLLWNATEECCIKLNIDLVSGTRALDMAGMFRKRLIEQPVMVENLEELDSPRPSANLHAAIRMLSPVKKGRNSVFFDGTIADSTSSMRIVGFSPEQQKKLSAFQQSKKPINIVNCEIKVSRQNENKMEVMLKNSTKIQESTRGIDATVFQEEESETPLVKLDELNQIQNFQKINVNVVVLSNTNPVCVSGGKTK